MNVLTLSIGRNILEAKSRERERMHGYATYLDQFHIVVLTRKEHGFNEEKHEGNLHLYPTNSKTRVGMLFDAFLIARNIIKKQNTPIVVSSQDPFEMGFVSYLLSLYKNTRLHIQIHGDYFGSPYWKGTSLLRRFRLWYARFILGRAQGIRVVSERIKRSHILWGIDEARITVLPIRPELETFLHAPHTVHDHDPFVFLIASRFAPEKNIPLMLRAFAKISALYPNVQLRIVGKGSEEQKIRSLITELGITSKVIIIPWTESVETEMQNADVFLSASDHEAYGLTLVEAMAVGLPLITTDVGCVGEVVKDGMHGIVVPVQGEDAFVRGMERMITERTFRESCSRAGRATAQKLGEVTGDSYAQTWVASLSLGEEAV